MNLSSSFDSQTLRVNRWRQSLAHAESLLDSEVVSAGFAKHCQCCENKNVFWPKSSCFLQAIRGSNNVQGFFFTYLVQFYPLTKTPAVLKYSDF